jgi:hypothetical protein
LIKRIGAQLDGASVADLLIPVNTDENSFYNIDLVMTIVEEFMSQHSDNGKAKLQDDEEIVEAENMSVMTVSSTSKLAVAKLIDGYLAEIAKDPNLPLPKLMALAEMASSLPRPTHDGLYRAIDMYLKVSLSVSTDYLHCWESENSTLLCMLTGAPKPIEE